MCQLKCRLRRTYDARDSSGCMGNGIEGAEDYYAGKGQRVWLSEERGPDAAPSETVFNLRNRF